MTRNFVYGLIGLILGIVLVLSVQRLSEEAPLANPVAPRTLDDVPPFSAETTNGHEEDLYSRLDRIAEIMALPPGFKRKEALHVLAGRSNSEKLQGLIFETNQVDDPQLRMQMLETLFYRFGEVDPQSALALSRTEELRPFRELEKTVWIAWARRDLDDALFEVKTQTTLGLERFAGQSVLAAFGYSGNETTDRIEQELGISASTGNQIEYVRQLSKRDPVEVIRYIDSELAQHQSYFHITTLTQSVDISDREAALSLANEFQNPQNRQLYLSGIKNRLAAQDPEATIQEIFSSNKRPKGELNAALSALAKTDMEKALQYIDIAPNAPVKQIVVNTVISVLAKEDPVRALELAKSTWTGGSGFNSPESIVLQAIAQTDPELALREAAGMGISPSGETTLAPFCSLSPGRTPTLQCGSSRTKSMSMRELMFPALLFPHC